MICNKSKFEKRNNFWRALVEGLTFDLAVVLVIVTTVLVVKITSNQLCNVISEIGPSCRFYDNSLFIVQEFATDIGLAYGLCQKVSICEGVCLEPKKILDYEFLYCISDSTGTYILTSSYYSFFSLVVLVIGVMTCLVGIFLRFVFLVVAIKNNNREENITVLSNIVGPVKKEENTEEMELTKILIESMT